MNITFLVNYDLASLLALNYLIPSLGKHNLAIFYSRKIANTANPKLSELSEFDSKKIDSIPQHCLGFKELNAEALNHINTSDYPRFASTEPDIVISIRHMTILKSAVIETPNLATINLHSGHLPRYQGVMATFWALRNLEQDIGTSLHLIEDSSIDTGSIISKSSSLANYQQSYLWNTLNVYKQGCENILLALQSLELNKPIASQTQSGQANYYSYPKIADIEDCSVPLFNQSDGISGFL